MIVFSTSKYIYFRDALCQHPGFSPGDLEFQSFPDGESYHRILTSVRGRDVVLVGGTIDDRATLEIFDLACGLVHQGVNTLMMVVPYFGYSTMERSSKSGEIVKAKNRALLLSSVPRARVCNEIVMMDLHTAGITYYFEGHPRPYHLSAMDLVAGIVGKLEGDIVLASTDAGRAKWVETLANRMHLPGAFVYKRRHSGNHTEIRGINADVSGKHVVIYDDMIRTGGSLIKAAQAYKDAGAIRITAITTHGVLPNNAMNLLRDCDLFETIITTDTHPRAIQLAQDSKGFLKVESMVPATAVFLADLLD